MSVAHALGGEVKEVKTRGWPAMFVALPPAGRVPLVIMDAGNNLRVVVTRTLAISESPTKIAARIPEIVTAAQTWMKDRDPQILSLFGVALALSSILEEEFKAPFGVEIPSEATTLELTGANATLDVQPGKVIVRVGSKAHDFMMLKRENVDEHRAKLIESVRAQIACFEHHRVANQRLHDVVPSLAKRLASAMQLPAPSVSIWGTVSHNSCEQATIAFGSREVRIEYVDGVFRVRAGLNGSSGLDTTLDTMDEAKVVAALQLAAGTLTFDDLKPGTRYRVLESYEGLIKGTTVTFLGFNDIDNHYGELEFEHAGKPIKLGGDYSNRYHRPLAETHRYLERM